MLLVKHTLSSTVLFSRVYKMNLKNNVVHIEAGILQGNYAIATCC